MIAAGVDLGGTNIAVGLVNEEGKIYGKASEPTKHSGTEWQNRWRLRYKIFSTAEI